MLISIVTTLYRSAPTVQEFYDRSKRAAEKITPDYEILLVNDDLTHHEKFSTTFS